MRERLREGKSQPFDHRSPATTRSGLQEEENVGKKIKMAERNDDVSRSIDQSTGASGKTT